MAISKGEWKAWITNKKPAEWTICIGKNGDVGIAKTIEDPTVSIIQRGNNANIIAAAVNACQSVNQDNPMAVAESIKDMYEELKEAKLQIEYLHDKFKVTGTGNTILARIDNTLAKIKGENNG